MPRFDESQGQIRKYYLKAIVFIDIYIYIYEFKFF